MSTTEEKVARLETRADVSEKNVSELWAQFNAHKTYSETQFRYIIDTVSNQYKQHIEKSEQRIKEHMRLQMQVNANEVAEAVTQKLKENAWSIAKIIEAAFKIGVLVGMAWLGVQQAKAETIQCDVESGHEQRH